MFGSTRTQFTTTGKITALLVFLLVFLPLLTVLMPNRAFAACRDGYTLVEGKCVPAAGSGGSSPAPNVPPPSTGNCPSGYTRVEGKCVPASTGGPGTPIDNPLPGNDSGGSDAGGGQTYTGSPDSVIGNCDKDGKNCTVKNCDQDTSCKKITSTLVSATNLLSALVGIIAVAMIIFGGIEFSTSGGDPQKVASGKKHITNAVIALVAFIFLWAFLNFLIPGGLFNG